MRMGGKNKRRRGQKSFFLLQKWSFGVDQKLDLSCLLSSRRWAELDLVFFLKKSPSSFAFLVSDLLFHSSILLLLFHNFWLSFSIVSLNRRIVVLFLISLPLFLPILSWHESMLMMIRGKWQEFEEKSSHGQKERREPRKYHEERIIVVNGFGRKSGKIDWLPSKNLIYFLIFHLISLYLSLSGGRGYLWQGETVDRMWMEGAGHLSLPYLW